MLTTQEIFVLFFVTLGPLKIVGPFAARTQGLAEERLHGIALHAFAIATVGLVVGVLLGQFVAENWHISLPAMTITAGIILFLVAVNQLMAQYKPTDTAHPQPLPKSPRGAAAQIVFPIVLTPYGIAAAIILLISSQGVGARILVLGLLVLVMLFDLAAMWFVRRILTGAMVLVLQVLGAVLAVLQVGLAIQLLLVGLRAAHLNPA